MASRALNIRLVGEWMSRAATEMVLADLESCGPWALQKKFKMDADTMAFIIFNLTFTLDRMVVRLNSICPTRWRLKAGTSSQCWWTKRSLSTGTPTLTTSEDSCCTLKGA